jgi:hypothetical protein
MDLEVLHAYQTLALMALHRNKRASAILLFVVLGKYQHGGAISFCDITFVQSIVTSLTRFER